MPLLLYAVPDTASTFAAWLLMVSLETVVYEALKKLVESSLESTWIAVIFPPETSTVTVVIPPRNPVPDAKLLHGEIKLLDPGQV